jgi:hypothetical protein
MTRLLIAATLCLAVVLPLAADDCRYEEPRNATVDAAGATRVRIDSSAGWLVVEGQPGRSSVEVEGTACADDSGDLAEIRLKAERQGSTVVVVAKIPSRSWGSSTMKLDMKVLVPAEIAVEIADGSGEITVHDVAALDIDDGSGSIEVTNVRGAVEIVDGSGEITVERAGAVRITDGSGDIDVTDCQSVWVNDGSGDIDLRDIRGDVEVDNDGSGDIVARGVGGNLRVSDDGSGDLRYEDVTGTVEVPDKHHDRHR